MIPRIIHLLWAQGEHDAPEIVKFCIEMWRTTNPDFDVRVYDKSDIDRLISGDIPGSVFKNMKIQFQSDLLRTKLLSSEGGIWVDASCMPNVPVASWIDSHGHFDFSAPRMNKPGRCISNWFMVSKQNGYLMSRQYDRLCRYWTTPKHLLPQVPESISEIEKNWRLFVSDGYAHSLGIAPYFLWHYNFSLLVEEDERAAEIFSASPDILEHRKSSFVNSFGNSAAKDPGKDVAKLLHFIRTTDCVLNKINWRNEYLFPLAQMKRVILERADVQSL